MPTSKPDLTRIWASSAPSANVVDPDTTTPGKFVAGWTAEVPPFEHFNFLQQLFTQGLVYNNEQGINQWDSSTTYPIGARTKGSNNKIYFSVLSQAANDPTSDDGTNWVVDEKIALDYSDLQSKMASGFLSEGDLVTISEENLYGVFEIFKDDGVTHYDHDSGFWITETGLTTSTGELAAKRRDIVVKPEFYGAVGDGVTSDQTAMFNACQYCYSSGLPLWLTGGKNYYRARVEVHGTFSVFGNGASVWYLGFGVTYIAGTGSGASAVPTAWPNDPSFDPDGNYDVNLYNVSSSATAGSSTLTLSSVSGLSVGDYVFIADDPSTASSPNNYIPKVFEFAIIKDITSNTLTFESKIKNAYSTSAVVTYSSGLAINCKVSDLKLTTNDDAYQYVIRSAYNCEMNNIEFAGQSAAGAATFCDNLVYHKVKVSSSYGPISQARGTVSATFCNFEHQLRSTPSPAPEDVAIFIEESFYNIYIENFNAIGVSFSARQIEMSGVAEKRTIFVTRSVFDTRNAFNGVVPALQNGSTQGCDMIFNEVVFATADESTPNASSYPGITGDAHNWHASNDSGDIIEFRSCKFYSTASTSSDTAFKTGSGFQGLAKFDDYCTFEVLSINESFRERGARQALTLSSPVTAGSETPEYRVNATKRRIELNGILILNGLSVNSNISTLSNYAPENTRYFSVACLVSGGGSWDSGTIRVDTTSGNIVWLGSQSTVVQVALDGVSWDL